jgi:hypothetical protein
VSPILVRPVREQLEHDRIIRLLQAKYKRKFEVGMNVGAEQVAPVGTGPTAIYPDLVLMTADRGHKLQGVIEVETGESVNHLEALAQWGHLSRLRAPFHLYVPAGMVDVARRLCEENQIHVTEIWSYHSVGDQIRFTLVHRTREAPPASARTRNGAAARPASSVPRRKPAARPAKSASRARKPAKKPARAQKRK